ncbi:MAG: tripartite tricarboxylate transporter substrate binding protein [Bacteroidota bacterium]
MPLSCRSLYPAVQTSLLICLLLLATGCKPTDNKPENYPQRPISFFVPWNPGGGTDTVSRALAVALQKHLDTSVNVINRTGGGGVVGHLALSQARSDGYTIGAVTGEITMMHWQGLTDLTVNNYTPIALLMNNPAALTVRADAPWQTLDDLLGALRTDPGTLLASGTSRGGIWDLARIGFLNEAGLEASAMPWVPSQGAAPALQELLAGGVQVVTVALAEAEALYRAGEVKVLGVMADDRLAAFPEIPTLKEQGINWQIGGWVSLGAPADLPDAVKAKLVAATRAAVSDSVYAAPLERAGFNLTFIDGDAFDNFLTEQDEISGRLLEMAGMSKKQGN